MPRIKQYENKYRNGDFTKAVRVRLAELEYRQKDLAAAAGICEASMSTLLRNPEKITVDKLRKMVKFLNMDQETVLKFCGF